MANYIEDYTKIINKATVARDEATKFYEKGVKASSPRARKALMEIKNLATDLRKKIQEDKNNM